MDDCPICIEKLESSRFPVTIALIAVILGSFAAGILVGMRIAETKLVGGDVEVLRNLRDGGVLADDNPRPSP